MILPTKPGPQLYNFTALKRDRICMFFTALNRNRRNVSFCRTRPGPQMYDSTALKRDHACMMFIEARLNSLCVSFGEVIAYCTS